jgi:dihydroflavonol-4-reductase
VCVTVLVTGGTGFVGSHVAARLVARGHDVRLLVRDPAKVARAPALRDVTIADVVVGDVTDTAAVARALEGCTHVVHAAAHVSLAERDADRAEAVNVGGTRLVIGTATELGVHSVYISSVAVFGVGHTRVTTETPLTDQHGSYTGSKVRAERIVRELQDHGGAIGIVYPSGVLGPDSPDVSANHAALVAWLRTPPRTTSGTSIVDVRDVAIGVERSLARPGRWMLGGRFLTWDELHSALQRVTGLPIRAVPMPPRTLRFAGRIGDVVKRVIPFDYPLTHEAMCMATMSCPYDSDPTRRKLELEWRPVDDTLTDSVRWLAEAGHVKAKLAGTLAP